MQCRMDHIVLNMDDEETMLDFYTRVLELHPERLAEYRAGTVPFPSVRLNTDTIIDFFPKTMWQHTVASGPGGRHFNHLCLALDKKDWDDLQDRLTEAAVAIEAGPVQRWGGPWNRDIDLFPRSGKQPYRGAPLPGVRLEAALPARLLTHAKNAQSPGGACHVP